MTQDNPKAGQGGAQLPPEAYSAHGACLICGKVLYPHQTCFHSEPYEPHKADGQTETDELDGFVYEHDAGWHGVKTGSQAEAELLAFFNEEITAPHPKTKQEFIDKLMARVRRYSHHQTEQVLERLKAKQDTCYDCAHDDYPSGETVPFVDVSAIDAELERIRGQG